MDSVAAGGVLNPSRWSGFLGASTLPLFVDGGGERLPAPRAVAAADDPAAKRPPGLSLVHNHSLDEKRIPPRGALLRVSDNGYCSHLRTPRPDSVRVPKGKRGTVKGLSRGAAARCKRLLLSVDHGKVAGTFEGCNTIPAGEFGFPEFRKFLKNWADRFMRRWPGVACSWVKELTGAGTPHLHFIVVFPVGVSVPSLREFRAWNDDAWAEVVKSTHPAHRKTACRVEVVRSWARVVRYLSSYLTEGSEGRDRLSDTGRMWGVIGRKCLPSSFREVVLNAAEKTEVSRLLVRYRQSQTTWLRSTGTHSLRKNWGRPSKGFHRLDADPLFRGVDGAPRINLKGFEADRLRVAYREDGFRLRRLRPRGYRREIIEKLWVGVAGEAGVERSPFSRPVQVWRTNKVTGLRERIWADEVNDVPMAWHYLPSAEVLRVVGFVRRDRLLGLTSAERRWLRPPGQRAIMRAT
jgi:hypothetical protein